MTTHPKRWLSHMRAFCAVIAYAVILVATAPGQAVAQLPAAVIMDARTGEIIQSSNPNSRVHPASLTKMMTLYIAFEALENGEISADTRVRISQRAARQPPSRLGLRAGQRIAFRYLIRAAALRSANDAAVAIAEALEGSVSNFADRMNRTARAIGMRRTTFRNPHGLTQSGHMSTARDMSILGRQLYFDYPEYYQIFSRISDSAGIGTVRNTNRRFLNGYRGADGIKTGFTNAAGYNLTAMAERNGVRILVTVMGARNSTHRYQRVVELMDRGFRLAPRRAAVRRPRRPNYVRAPEDRGSGVAAGRTIRLQTAPTRSLFPRPRPQQPSEVPSEELVAALRTEIDAVIEDIRPDETQAAEAGSEAEAPEQLAAVAPERSPIPAPRPSDVAVSPQVQVARVGDTDLTAAPLTEDQPTETQLATAEAVTSPTASEVALAELTPDQSGVMLQFDHSDGEVAQVGAENGQLSIPGMPTIVLNEDETQSDEAPVATASLAPLTPLSAIEPRGDDLHVDDEGRIMWRDEEVLDALEDEAPDEQVLAPAMVLTSRADEEQVAPEPTPEIVTRLSTSGGRVWAVDLGIFPSRFDANRYLLRVALSESTTLGRGVRRTQAASGGVRAEIHSLSEADAQTACGRLTALGRDCAVIEPTG